MRTAGLLALVAVLILGLAVTVTAAPPDQAFLWNGNHWKQVSQDGKVGYIFGIGNLADFEVAAGAGRGRNACISKTFADELKKRTVMQIVQEVDKYYQENPGKLDTSVIEVVVKRCTSVCPPESPGGAKKK
jgi:hypothetical protein